MNNQNDLNILDCTLRDGGCVNDFCFGTETMVSILRAVEDSGIRYAELGYLDAEEGSPAGRSKYSNMEAIRQNGLLERKNPLITYLAMIDYGRFPAGLLPDRQREGLDGIRLCFHKKDMEMAVRMGQKILNKGYLLFLQPMVCSRYTDQEFEKLLILTGETLSGASAFYIVDSFGSMDKSEVMERFRMADRLLPAQMGLGLHTHNNRRLCFPIAKAVLRESWNRKIFLDSTLFGIGKGAGNLKTEVLAEYLNRFCGASYDPEPLEKAARQILRPLKTAYIWGWRPEYVLSAKLRLTPHYADLFREYGMTADEIGELLSRVPDDRKDSFDKMTAEAIVKDYMSKERGQTAI